MELQLRGSNALVTAATSGIGLAIAQGLAQEGVQVNITGRTNQTVEAAVRRLRERVVSADIRGIVCDCTTVEGARKVSQVLSSVDILVNNLGVYSRKNFFDTTEVDWEEAFSVNVFSGVRLAQQYARSMVGKGWGRILFVSSDAALNVPVNMIPYAASKAAVLAVSRGLAIEMAGTGVTVNVIIPGPTNTENANSSRRARALRAGKSESDLEREVFVGHRATSLTRRLAQPEEIASMVVFLSSRLSNMTTGSAVRVDGGVVNQIV